MVLHWPAGFDARGEVRSQFCHIVDLMPTLLDCCGVDAPSLVDGVDQQPLDGASIAPTFADRSAPNPRNQQYFEMMGSRAIFSDEWKATTDHVSPLVIDEAKLLRGSRDYEQDQWHLFHLPSDFAEAHDVASENPEVVERLHQEWMAEAERNNVFPLFGGWDPRDLEKTSSARPSAAMADASATRRRVFRPGGSPVTDEALPKFNAGGTLMVRCDPGPAPEGVLCAIGDWTQGFALYVAEGRLAFALNIAGEETVVVSSAPVSAASTELGFRLTPAADQGVEIQVLIDGQVAGTGTASRPMPVGMMQVGGTGLCIGYDRGFPVTEGYEPPAAFTGEIRYVSISTEDGQVDPSDQLAQALHED